MIDVEIFNTLEMNYRLHHSDRIRQRVSEGIHLKILLKVADT